MSAGAAAAAAAEAERQRQEEEEMTKYTDADLQGDWEFKIVRANTAAFRNPEVLRQVVPRKPGRAGPLWRNSTINVCDSNARSVQGQAMRAWGSILTVVNTEFRREP